MAVRTAKGIKGIKGFLADDAMRFGWHVFNANNQVWEDYSEISGIATIHQMNRRGYILDDFQGNSLFFSRPLVDGRRISRIYLRRAGRPPFVSQAIDERPTDTSDARYGIGNRSDWERAARKVAAEFVDPSNAAQLDTCLQR